MTRLIFGLIDRIFIVLGALLFSQAPQFFSQYMHRLSGHLDEIRVYVSSIQQKASLSGKPMHEYIFKFSGSVDPDSIFLGNMMQNMVTRYQEHSQAMLALTDATPFTRPLVFLRHFNFEIVKGTLAHFQPGLLFNLEGLAYALIGMGIGYCCYCLLKTLISLFLSLFSKNSVPEKKQFS